MLSLRDLVEVDGKLILNLEDHYESAYFGDPQYTDGVVLTMGSELIHGLLGVKRGKVMAIGVK
tara:strand:- start:1277 stop:1465 length:189 start_codon:yes stop_codon:yes gene_type:complete